MPAPSTTTSPPPSTHGNGLRRRLRVTGGAAAYGIEASGVGAAAQAGVGGGPAWVPVGRRASAPASGGNVPATPRPWPGSSPSSVLGTAALGSAVGGRP